MMDLRFIVKFTLLVIFTLTFPLIILINYDVHAATVTFTYDSLNRVTSVDYENGVTETYTYDTAGNRITLISTASDVDGDGISDDGDGNGNPGDNPCMGGNTTNCDDNCPNTSNPNQADTDSDGVGDVCDNCYLTANPGQQDTDGDEYGNMCDADLDNDGFVGPNDYNMFGAAWYTADPNADFDSDGFVGPNDYNIFGSFWYTSAPWH